MLNLTPDQPVQVNTPALKVLKSHETKKKQRAKQKLIYQPRLIPLYVPEQFDSNTI